MTARGRLPTTEQYRSAFDIARPRITELQWRLLEAHYMSPDQTATANELALMAGRDTYRATNAAYSRLGMRLRRLLRQPARAVDAQVGIITSFWGRTIAHPEVRLAMHLPVYRALNKLEWFDEETTVVSGARDEAIDRMSAREGLWRRRLIVHRRRERSLRPAKIRAAMASSNDGRLRCEVPHCGFDFESVYGEAGHGAAEVHHRKPLSQVVGEITTTLDDLAVVCANCHRMIHLGGKCRDMATLLASSIPTALESLQ